MKRMMKISKERKADMETWEKRQRKWNADIARDLRRRERSDSKAHRKAYMKEEE